MDDGWIGFDLDGTLATYDGWFGEDTIGDPIKPMIDKLKLYLNQGFKCKILTARAGNGDRQKVIIQDWLEKQGLPRLEVTDRKDYMMLLMYDDRSVAVESDTGLILGGKEIL